MVLKTEVQVTTGFFRGKECIKENLNTWFFPKFKRKTAPISVNFFCRSAKGQSMTAEELLEEKVKVEINFDRLCLKFLTWVSFLHSTSPGEPFEEEIVSINYFSPFFFEQETFQISREVFRQGCQVSNLCDWRRFLMKVFFDRTICLYNYFQKLSGRFLNFCLVFWQRCQNCIPCVWRKIPRKNFHSKKSQLCFRILIHKNLILRNNSACS